MKKTLCILLTCIIICAFFATGRVATPKAPVVDIETKTDSLLVMADDYAEALASKPEFARTRLNILKKYYAAIPTDEARDSVRSRLFDFYVSYVEADNASRAEAFKTVFLTLAPDDDEHLGRIYVNDLDVARENFDTTAMKECMVRLSDYADRMQYDYDEELSAARAFVRTVRNRPSIRRAVVGVWVAEDVAAEDYDDPTDLIHSVKVLQIRDLDNPSYRELFEAMAKQTGDAATDSCKGLEVTKCEKYLDKYQYHAYGIQLDWPGYYGIDAWEYPAFGFEQLPDATVRNAPFVSMERYAHGAKKRVSGHTDYDEQSYSVYAFWGDEKLRRPAPEVGAMLRQTTQQTQAAVAGELSRSGYSFGERLGGNLTAGVVSAGINAAVDALMVSTETLWSVDMTLHMENPCLLIADIYMQTAKSKSNSTDVDYKQYHKRMRYYRWEPADSVMFMGKIDWRPITLRNLPKAERKALEKKMNDFAKQWEKEYKAEVKARKERLKSLAKGSEEYESARAELKMFEEERPPQPWMAWNAPMLDKLRRKAAAQASVAP